MSAEIVNLRQFRKKRQREEADRKAAENRALHGLSKADRKLKDSEKSRLQKTLDQGHREPGDDKD